MPEPARLQKLPFLSEPSWEPAAAGLRRGHAARSSSGLQKSPDFGAASGAASPGRGVDLVQLHEEPRPRSPSWHPAVSPCGTPPCPRVTERGAPRAAGCSKHSGAAAGFSVPRGRAVRAPFAWRLVSRRKLISLICPRRARPEPVPLAAPPPCSHRGGHPVLSVCPSLCTHPSVCPSVLGCVAPGGSRRGDRKERKRSCQQRPRAKIREGQRLGVI